MSTVHELEQRIKVLESVLGRGIEHLSVDEDGYLKISDMYFNTPHSHGYILDQYGNFIHTGNTDTASWGIKNRDGVATLYHNYETGNLTITGSFKSNRKVVTKNIPERTVNKNTTTIIGSVTLPSGKFVVIGTSGVGAGTSDWTNTQYLTPTSGYQGLSLSRGSGSGEEFATVTNKFPAYSGSGCQIVGYFNNTSQSVIDLYTYLYGFKSTSVWGWIIAIPL